jgi:hypothetical protein
MMVARVRGSFGLKILSSFMTTPRQIEYPCFLHPLVDRNDGNFATGKTTYHLADFLRWRQGSAGRGRRVEPAKSEIQSLPPLMPLVHIDKMDSKVLIF